jgi:SAM-dependent methyltransferase
MSNPACPTCQSRSETKVGGFAAWQEVAFKADDGRKNIVEIGQRIGLDPQTDFYHCRSCGTFYVHPFPPPEKIAQFYQAYYANENYGGKRNKKIKRSLRRMKRLKKIAGGGELLDVGCNLGYATEAARRVGFKAVGLDIDATSVSCAAEEFPDCEFQNAALSSVAAENRKFDVVYCSEVIEHFPDPRDFCMNLGKALKQGGVLYLTTPDAGHAARPRSFFKWAEVKPPEHLVWLNRKALRFLLEKAGFVRFNFLWNFKPGIKLIAVKGSKPPAL